MQTMRKVSFYIQIIVEGALALSKLGLLLTY